MKSAPTADRPDIFRQCCHFICPGFRTDDASRKVLNELFRWAEGCSPVYDSARGFLLTGDYGTGKSTLMQILNRYDWYIRGRTPGDYPIGGFRIDSASYVANGYTLRGRDALELYTYNGGNPRTVCFDELGREPLPAKYFGTELNVMQYIVQCRYELRSECLTHLTTNLSLPELQQRYGGYIADRINEMFNVIELRGKSHR